MAILRFEERDHLRCIFLGKYTATAVVVSNSYVSIIAVGSKPVAPGNV